jgi:hypothetical protein
MNISATAMNAGEEKINVSEQTINVGEQTMNVEEQEIDAGNKAIGICRKKTIPGRKTLISVVHETNSWDVTTLFRCAAIEFSSAEVGSQLAAKQFSSTNTESQPTAK